MYEGINAEIAKVKESLRKRERIEGLVKSAEQHLKEESKRKEELMNILEKEEMDVRKLEKLSVKALLFTILGNKEEKLNKEQSEFLAAKLKFDECCNSMRFVQEEIDEYYRQLREIGDVRYEYQELMKKKEQLVMKAYDSNTRTILDLTEEITDIGADLREIKEAIMAGNSVLASLERAADSLDSAESWGTWDMLGGGLLTDMAKHSNIDEAVDYIQDAKAKFNRFKRELGDVDLSIDVDVNIGSFDKFADYFFDGLFADWNVQSKIEDSAESVNYAINKVKSTVDVLESKYNRSEAKLKGLKSEIKSIIENA